MVLLVDVKVVELVEDLDDVLLLVDVELLLEDAVVLVVVLLLVVDVAVLLTVSDAPKAQRRSPSTSKRQSSCSKSRWWMCRSASMATCGLCAQRPNWCCFLWSPTLSG